MTTSVSPAAVPTAEYPADALAPYDAVLLVSFGGPEQPDDVVPFLENVTRGRGIPRERLVEVGQHYYEFGGRSPINEQCRTLLAALEAEMTHRGWDLPLYWGNRNWHPFLDATFAEIAEAGHRRVLTVVTSAYPSYSSCRQYRENLFDAASELDLNVDRVRHYATHPGFVTASVDATLAAIATLPEGSAPRILFVTHSIPDGMARTSGPKPRSPQGAYVDWHVGVAEAVTREVSARLGTELIGELTYCSRSGPPSQPWLEPDINDRLAELSAEGVGSVVAVPIGFISDHMEVIYDLDTEASATAAELELGWARAATAGVHPAFVAGLVDLMAERAAIARSESTTPQVVAGLPTGWVACQPECCPNQRQPGRPTLLTAEPA